MRRDNRLVHELPSGTIYCSDALDLLQSLEDESAEIVFLDPPFNLGKKYGSRASSQDRIDNEEYRQYLLEVLKQSVRIMRPGGALYLYHIPKWAIVCASALESHLAFRHWIAISMKNVAFVNGNALYPAHYALLYYTKGNPLAFSRPKVPPPTCRHCGKYIRDYGGYRRYVENGINLTDVWDDVSPVRHSKYKHRVANELPLVIPQRVMLISGIEGGTVVDPFAGTGSTLAAARDIGMRFIAADADPAAVGVMLERLQSCDASQEGE